MNYVDAFVELVDIYPTLCELASLPLPPHLEGTSFVRLLDAPSQPWKTTAFTQVKRGGAMAHSLRTDRYRFTRWAKIDSRTETVAVELYDFLQAPVEAENSAERPENAALVKKLTMQLRAGWQAAVPRSMERQSQ